MSSKLYHLSNTNKQKANIKNQIRKRKPSDNQSERSEVVHYPHADRHDSYVTLKSEMLGRKLKKKKDNRSTMQYSRLTMLKQSQIMSPVKHGSGAIILTTLKEQKDIIYQERDMSIQKIEDNLAKLAYKHRQMVQMQISHKNQTNIQINILLKMIDQLQERNRSFNACQYNLYIYSDILNRYKKDNKNRMNKVISKTSNKNIIKESSLLQSFKKNMEDDDPHVTLKYSEQSIFRERSPPNQTLPEGWDSFRNNLKTTLFKSANKAQVEKGIPTEDDFFTSIKSNLIQQITSEKTYLINEYNESSKILQQFENVLQRIIEQVACEKVERDEYIKHVYKQNNEDLLQVSSLVSKMKMEQMSERFSFEQKMKQLQESVSQQLAEQKYVRRGQQKAMIRMMLQVVQFFN